MMIISFCCVYTQTSASSTYTIRCLSRVAGISDKFCNVDKHVYVLLTKLFLETEICYIFPCISLNVYHTGKYFEQLL